MKALKTDKKADSPTYNRTKSDQDSARYRHKTEPDFVASGYYPPERFVPLLAKFSHPANVTQRTQLFNQLQTHYGNHYVQRVVDAYRSQNVEEDESTLASEIILGKDSGRPLEPGNQAVKRMFKSDVIQAKLKIGQPNDIYEQEADKVADAVMRMPEPEVQRQVEEEEEILQTKGRAGRTPEVTPNLEVRIHALKGGGQPLQESIRSLFEPRFGYDFSQVRVHTDTEADRLNRALSARAFTQGQDIFFQHGAYNPSSSSGRGLLTHELTHVLQQTRNTPRMAGTQVQLSPDMRRGRRTRTLEIGWGNFDDFRRSVEAQVVRRLEVPDEWIGQLMFLSESNLRFIYDELERSNPLRPDGEIVRIVADFNAGGQVGQSTLRFGIPRAAPVPPEREERPAERRPPEFRFRVGLLEPPRRSYEDIIRGIQSGDPVWQQAYTQATIEFMLRHRGEFASPPSFEIIGDIDTLRSNLGTDRPTAERVQRELLDLTAEWYQEYRRQMQAGGR
jgi:hypothetical protein